ncbi:hypothetical protein DASC09_034730 [Saccharomycopsis crataegensis]|uniref:Uncharacterized protein n=1 Tax=Saccharomycopsis crataegensis TaxID=43959 RepID=A0AAV5QPR1_9ASCO|nr:hypothetical protein DASC09_034730 [Saccharomycopsis crataegensis]
MRGRYLENIQVLKDCHLYFKKQYDGLGSTFPEDIIFGAFNRLQLRTFQSNSASTYKRVFLNNLVVLPDRRLKTTLRTH